MKTAPETTDTWTVARVLAFAASDFQKRGIESPRLEADLLLAEILGVDRIRLIIESSRPLSEDELSRYKALIVRRRADEPTAYILGRREFFGAQFRVTSDVLIPRADTEILVEVALERTSHRALSGRALDLCTGSGCVGLSFARTRRTWEMTLTDISEAALAVARHNALELGLVWGVRFLPSDLVSGLRKDERFELITANPPYIPSAEIPTLEPMVRDYEPKLALDGGTDGLDFYAPLLRGALLHLVPGGVLAVEVGAGQAEAVAHLFERSGFSDIGRSKDFGGHERVVSGRAPRKT